MSGADYLARRWTPSHAQDEAAHAALQGSEERYVYTAHVLLNKEHGWWGAAVEIKHLDGVYTDREGASTVAQEAAERRHRETGKPTSGGYTVHHLLRQGDPDVPRSGDGEMWLTMWAVFEDILACYPIPEWSSRRSVPGG